MSDLGGTDGVTPAAGPVQGYAGDSADSLTLGLVLLVLGSFLAGAAWAGPGSPALLAVGVVLGTVGLVLLVRGTHRLATNVDRVLRTRLTGSPREGGTSPWPPEA